MKMPDERYLTIRILSVCNLIAFFVWMLAFAYLFENGNPLGMLLFIPVLTLEVYEVLYYRRSSKEVKKEVSEKCRGLYGRPFHPYYIVIVYGGISIILTAMIAYATLVK